MKKASALLNHHLLLSDGAMGTYYRQLAGAGALACEAANTGNPDLIRQIHREYIAAGSRLIRTNTFATAALFGDQDPSALIDNIRAGYRLAQECAGDLAWVAADIGPVYNLDPEPAASASRLAVQTFLDEGADLFIFETFADPDDFLQLSHWIKQQNPEAVIIASLSISADGYTQKGLPLSLLTETLENDPAVDIWGINCGIGPTHLKKLLERMDFTGKPMTLMPNSGYPRRENQRLMFDSDPAYFAQLTASLVNARTRIIGGCCGTTPDHIRALSDQLKQPGLTKATKRQAMPAKQPDRYAIRGASLAEKIDRGKFVLLCELDPPADSRMDKIIGAAKQLQLADFDAITVADSPLARVRMDPVGCASRLMRETGLPVLPHLCCRDRNVNAIRSLILSAHADGIRQILAVTGDAIPESDRGFVQSVFNLNSQTLLKQISQMNQDLFKDDPLLAAAALDPGVANPQAELARVLRKQEQGARIILTQPVYDLTGIDLIRAVRSHGLKVMVGLMPLVSYRNARYMSQEVPGINIPRQTLEQFNPEQSREDAVETGIRLTVEIARLLRQDADGFYLIAPFNRADIIVRIRERLVAENII